jgi:parallel beta-helix repeat protein
MRRMWMVTVAVVVAVATASILFVPAVSGRADDPLGVRLPGAAAVIDASRYPSLQAAIDALPDEGGVVRIPPGTFEIAGPLRVSKSDVLIEGAGTATHIKNVSTEGEPALVLQHAEGRDDRKSELWRIGLADLRITGNAKSGNGIEARRVNEIFIDGVTVSYHGGDGIRLYYCYEDPRICDSLITYNKKTGLDLIACHDIVVASNQFEENLDAVRCMDGFNLCMTGNNLDDHLRDGIVIENTYGSVVSGNMIEECSGTAIVLDRDCYGVTLSANVIAHNSGGGIDLRDAHGCAVSANTFTIMGAHALLVGPNSGRITVAGNNFSDSYIGDGRFRRTVDDREAGGIVLEGTADLAVVGNVFAGVRPKALAVEGAPSTRVLFSSNILTDSQGDQEKLAESLVADNLSPSDR